MEAITQNDLYIICDILCNDMELYTKEEFINYAITQTYLGELLLSNLWDWYWKLTPLQRFEFDYTEYSEKVNELNN